jgi:DNA modification methylase
MPEYICDICNKIFKQKGHLNLHKLRKNPCKKDDTIEKIIEKKIEEKLGLSNEDESETSDEEYNSMFNGINLFELYSEELKQNLTDEEFTYFESHYKVTNVSDYVDLYCSIIKKRSQKDENIELLQSIKQDNTVKILWGDCYESLKKLPTESVGLMTTSPPYYNARDYSIWPDLKSYLDDMTKIIKECYRVLDNHRVFVWNVSDVVDNDNMEKIKAWGDRKIPLPAYFIRIFEECGFTFIDDIIWDKGQVQSSRHKNKPYPFFQYPMNCYEHILIFHKHRLEKDTKYPCSDCGSLNIKSNSYTSKGIRSWECCNRECNRSSGDRGKRFSLKTIMTQNPIKQNENKIPYEFSKLWRRDIRQLSPVIKINSKGKNKLGHTAPFPADIPEMAVRFFSYKGDIVLDMFGGSFTTPIVAKKLERIGVGMELRKDLFEQCIKTNLASHECEFTEI